MTVQEYNTIFYPAHRKAESFISCLDHALEKCDENTKMQLSVIGWDEETKNIIQHALYVLEHEMKDVMMYRNTTWWRIRSEENKS